MCGFLTLGLVQRADGREQPGSFESAFRYQYSCNFMNTHNNFSCQNIANGCQNRRDATRRRIFVERGLFCEATKARILPIFIGAGEGNRTLVVSLGSFCSTIELHPRCLHSTRVLAKLTIAS